jgi:hypothetical protein
MLISLKTNFKDFYDHQFAGSWQKADIIFSRYTTDGMDRRSMFMYMKEKGLNVPSFGTVKEVYDLLAKDIIPEYRERWLREVFKIVVHLNVFDHCGDGKILLPATEAMEKYPNHLGALHVVSVLDGTYSYRLLKIGKRQFTLKYTSNDEWRSNCGNVEVQVIEERKQNESIFDSFDYPIFAIDYIDSMDTTYIDFNISPGLKHTGIEDMMTAKDVYTEIEEWYLTKALKSV